MKKHRFQIAVYNGSDFVKSMDFTSDLPNAVLVAADVLRGVSGKKKAVLRQTA